MPRQLNFPLHSQPENMVNHPHSPNYVLNYTKQVFFFFFSIAFHFTGSFQIPSLSTARDLVFFPDTLLLLFQPYGFWWGISRIALVSLIFTVLRTQLCFSWRVSRALMGRAHATTAELWKHYRLCRGKGEQLSLKIPQESTTCLR